MIKPRETEPFKGTYQVIKYNNPNVVYKTQEVSSKYEFDTLLDEVVQYNKNHPDEDKRIVIQKS